MKGTLKCSLGSQAQHAHSWEDHTRSIQQGTSNHTQHFHNIQQQNNNNTQTYCELFHQTIRKHCLTRSTQNKLSINRATHTIQGYNITLTTTQVLDAINQGKNKNSQGPDILNIRHLKHIGPLGLMSMLKTALNTTHMANIV